MPQTLRLPAALLLFRVMRPTFATEVGLVPEIVAWFHVAPPSEEYQAVPVFGVAVIWRLATRFWEELPTCSTDQMRSPYPFGPSTRFPTASLPKETPPSVDR